MGVRLPVVALAMQIVLRSALAASRAATTSSDVPRGPRGFFAKENEGDSERERNPDVVRRGALEVEPWFMEAGE
ncbi:hypothetical protein FH972_013289 [Carpinus fangiana]|uniref:Uncharacterized protein n=1 Tax=Carpinus fangiana TaxID=176857 RepID=A0A5N6R791_9ROSI|nr:hypothetical protein FH972_013289 [Carpinus fangiana]